ncbi:HlyD family secretion protein [Acidimangrovimonas sediminis]|uniref:HlyD family secretion protein n=1 Tax=Acidimangrovimonas sediminis TaxID=2056283 RepID=UPI000C808F0B|nr:HlyD family secretion protein [Acidimangrovimonas sediminis]
MKNIKLIIAGALVLAIGVGLYFWWQYEDAHPSTEDAFLRAHIVNVAAQVTGQVISVDVHENEKVTKGTVLFRLDPAQYRNAVKSSEAQVKMARDALQATAAQIQAAKQGVGSAQSTYDTAKKQLDRTQALFKNGNISEAALEQQQSQVAQDQASLDKARSSLTQANSDQQSKQDSLASAQAQLATAQLNLDHTVVKAPADGWISNLDLRPGATASAYTPLFALVESDKWWVEANFKETDLTRIRTGQPVSISIDMLPGVKLKGHVESVGAGSGSTFSLLPSENASGNWVKVTQRFAVRIALDKTDVQLRTGASVTATVDTTAGGDGSDQAGQ